MDAQLRYHLPDDVLARDYYELAATETEEPRNGPVFAKFSHLAAAIAALRNKPSQEGSINSTLSQCLRRDASNPRNLSATMREEILAVVGSRLANSEERLRFRMDFDRALAALKEYRAKEPSVNVSREPCADTSKFKEMTFVVGTLSNVFNARLMELVLNAVLNSALYRAHLRVGLVFSTAEAINAFLVALKVFIGAELKDRLGCSPEDGAIEDLIKRALERKALVAVVEKHCLQGGMPYAVFVDNDDTTFSQALLPLKDSLNKVPKALPTSIKAAIEDFAFNTLAKS